MKVMVYACMSVMGDQGLAEKADDILADDPGIRKALVVAAAVVMMMVMVIVVVVVVMGASAMVVTTIEMVMIVVVVIAAVVIVMLMSIADLTPACEHSCCQILHAHGEGEAETALVGGRHA